MGLNIGDNATPNTDNVETTTTVPSIEDISKLPEGSDEYNAAVLQVAQSKLNGGDPTPSTTGTTTTKPEHIPVKFWNADKGEVNYEAMAKSYTELEKKLGSPKEETTPTTQPDPTGLDKYTQEFTANKTLSAESYAELQTKGFDKALVDQFIAGQMAIAQSTEYQATQDRNEVLAVVGGLDKYQAMAQWAATNLTADEITMFDKQVESSKESATMAMQWLKTKYEIGNGSNPQRRLSGNTDASQSNGFASQAQAIAAMQDPRYEKDPAYRNEVLAKLAILHQQGS